MILLACADVNVCRTETEVGEFCPFIGRKHKPGNQFWFHIIFPKPKVVFTARNLRAAGAVTVSRQASR